MSLIVVAGCMGAGLEEPTPELSDLIANLEGDPLQGRHILGERPDSLEAAGKHFRVSATPANRDGFRLAVNAAGEGGANGTHLVANHSTEPAHTGPDGWFLGMIMSENPGGTGRQLRIREIGSSGSSTLYFLDYQLGERNTVGWVDYCDGTGGAIAITGYYDHQRIHRPGPWISFACPDSAAQKCDGWGYVAGNAGAGNTNWDHHQACTSMTNANYCGDGDSHTFEGTPILIRDFRPDFANPSPADLSYPSGFPMNPDRYYIEAAWGPDGTPRCLSRSRWMVLPPEQCPGVLHPSKSAAAKFCEDASLEDIESSGALIVNASKVMTAPLLHWRNPTTGDDVTTLRGYREHLDVRSAPGLQHAPFPGYSEYKGVDSVVLRNLPSTLQGEGAMIPLYMYFNEDTGDRVIATQGLSLLQEAGYESGDLEGYVFPAPVAGPRHEPMKPLWLCRLDNDYLVTIAPSSIGCDPVERLGYALPPPPPSSDTP